ncbi:DUF4054 domain-containing protein [Pelagibacterium sp. H642]|uniref:DUF4054 domain-containing protein n=1 Tax=Pelagibacterium sp. H642 TaxID=1881069 RepID=UPI0028150892|nr:DUF4054 domain-containing protein [Pelagibacterium sp. H642]WMT90150.1 DUF4054 domain-containing protein [Pelagibacterium sp. H642]
MAMASYDPVTPAEFKAAKPQFASVPDETVQMYLDMAGLWVDKSWPERLYRPGVIAATCHLMTLEGLGSDAESQGQASGAAQYQSIKSGELTLTRYQKAAGDMSFADWLGQTKCGEFFLQLLSMAKAGPRVAMGGVRGGCPSPYAKDWPGPAYGWPGVFGGL